jgi:hypothetical protein
MGMIAITSNAPEVKAALEKMPKVIYDLVREEFNLFGITFRSEMAPNFKGRPNLITRTGNLLKGWEWKVSGNNLSNLSLRLFNLVPYANMQEADETTITPKNAQYLAIPLPAALTGAGVPRYKSPLRDDPSMAGAFVIKSKIGNLLLAKRDGKKITPLFILKKSVTVHGRMGARKKLEEKAPAMQERILNRIMESWHFAMSLS